MLKYFSLYIQKLMTCSSIIINQVIEWFCESQSSKLWEPWTWFSPEVYERTCRNRDRYTVKYTQLQLWIFSFIQSPFNTNYIKFSKENYISHSSLRPLFSFNLSSSPLQISSSSSKHKHMHTHILSLSLSLISSKIGMAVNILEIPF